MTADLGDKQGFDEAAREERKAFLALTPDDERAAGTLKQWFAKIAPQLIDDFYQHLLSHSHTARFLQDPMLVERLKREQLRHFEELVSGEYGEEYFERRLRVGETHRRIGLEPQWTVGAYSLYLQNCFPEFAERLGTEMPPQLLALLKVVLLDIGLTLGTCRVESVDRDESEPDNLAKRERKQVERILKRERYNRSRAARALGINRRSLFRLIEKYEIEFPDKGL